MPRSFVEVALLASPELSDDLVAAMSLMGFDGFLEEEETLKGYIGSSAWDEESLADLTRAVEAIARSHDAPPPRITVSTIADRNWNAQWEGTITPIKAGKRIVISPTWHRYDPLPGEILLTIDPKMSFGTGYHESTRLLLGLLEQRVRSGDEVLDVGTGTGVLAIASIRLGARAAVGVDTDEWAFENAQENVRLNGVESNVSIRLGGIAEVSHGPFNLVMANIQRNVIEQLLPSLLAHVASGGRLLLSGLLLDDRNPLREVLHTAGAVIEEEATENGWLALVVDPGSGRKPAHPAGSPTDKNVR